MCMLGVCVGTLALVTALVSFSTEGTPVVPGVLPIMVLSAVFFASTGLVFIRGRRAIFDALAYLGEHRDGP
jgi:hypothetical protein